MRVLSGIQPSGMLHLGNYFGMMKPVIDRQQECENFIFIADYHALTTQRDPEALRHLRLDAALDFLACGLDPERTAFYFQSDLPEVTELSWLLSVLTPMGLLERCHSYKDKTDKGIAASHGLFAYPVLMAADILVVDADVVPVGRDQKQHLEVTRDIALKFNHTYGEVFRIPEPSIQDHVAVVPGVDGQKMSKSYQNTLDIFAPLKATRKRMMKIVTDSKELEDPKDPDACNVFALYRLLAPAADVEAMAARYREGGLGYGTVKKELYERFEAAFEGPRQRRAELEQNLDYVHGVLRTGAETARAVARNTLDRAREAVGLA